MPQIRPITYLRNTTEISDLCHARREPVFITKNGYGDLVVMSIETYEAMLETTTVDAAIAEAEAEFERDGQLYDAKDALAAGFFMSCPLSAGPARPASAVLPRLTGRNNL